MADIAQSLTPAYSGKGTSSRKRRGGKKEGKKKTSFLPENSDGRVASDFMLVAECLISHTIHCSNMNVLVAIHSLDFSGKVLPSVFFFWRNRYNGIYLDFRGWEKSSNRYIESEREEVRREK